MTRVTIIRGQLDCVLKKMATKDYHHLFKVLLLGSNGVGKSNLLSRFANGTYNWANFPTIGETICYNDFDMCVHTSKRAFMSVHECVPTVQEAVL